MKVYRITRDSYKNDISGTGARITGGRWNKKGIAVLYVSESEETAKAEVLRGPAGRFLPDQVLLEYQIPDNMVFLNITFEELNNIEWDKTPYDNETQDFLEPHILSNAYFGIRVPSVANPGSFNYVLCAEHPMYGMDTLTLISDTELKSQKK